MRFFRSTKRQMHGLNAKMPPPPASLKSSAGQKETTIVYTGGALCVTLQRAKSRFLEEEGPTRLVWSKKQQRLGLTFVELPQGGLAVKDVPDMRSDVSPGQELIGVSKESVIGKSLQEVLEMLQSAPSPCVLDFTQPPSPIMVSEVLEPARLLSVRKGMVLRSVNNSSMVGAKLSDVGAALHGAVNPLRRDLRSHPTKILSAHAPGLSV